MAEQYIRARGHAVPLAAIPSRLDKPSEFLKNFEDTVFPVGARTWLEAWPLRSGRETAEWATLLDRSATDVRLLLDRADRVLTPDQAAELANWVSFSGPLASQMREVSTRLSEFYDAREDIRMLVRDAVNEWADSRMRTVFTALRALVAIHDSLGPHALSLNAINAAAIENQSFLCH